MLKELELLQGTQFCPSRGSQTVNSNIECYEENPKVRGQGVSRSVHAGNRKGTQKGWLSSYL